VIVGDLDIEGIAVVEAKAATALVIDPDRMLSRALAFQGFKPVRRGQSQVLKSCGGLQLAKSHDCPLADVGRQSPTLSGVEQSRGFDIGERSDYAGCK
jgi:hypothetical protein